MRDTLVSRIARRVVLIGVYTTDSVVMLAVGPHQLTGAVGRCVVDHDDVERDVSDLTGQRFELFQQCRFPRCALE